VLPTGTEPPVTDDPSDFFLMSVAMLGVKMTAEVLRERS
jgi:hypothetical protein